MESLILVGGGLANSLIAYLSARRGKRPLIIEKSARLGGNHTWSFHHDDVSPELHAELEPLIRKSWTRQSVSFPGHSRELEVPYYSISSPDVHEAVVNEIGDRVLFETEVRNVDPRSVLLSRGRSIFARAVIDARGPAPSVPLAIPVGYQKFLGQDVELDAPHGLDGPVIMDATVSQTDGFRFVYLLPWTESSLLIEDTYYSDSPELAREELRAGIRSYAERRGWRIVGVRREEEGVLPIPLGGELESIWPSSSKACRAGAMAGLFHPTTGYSLPYAAEVAHTIANMTDVDATTLYSMLRDTAQRTWDQGRFFRFLNRMLFRAAQPHERVEIFERFYRLPEPLIRRFYRGRLKLRDGARLLIGKPPVDVRRALECLREEVAGAENEEMNRA